MNRRDERLREALTLAGFEPDSNICKCLHPGGRHTQANVCLDCGDSFASMTANEQWEHAIAVVHRALGTSCPAGQHSCHAVV